MFKGLNGIALLGLLLWSSLANAHSFGQVYNLPVPFWLYAWGAAAALLLSFVVVGLFLSRPQAIKSAPSLDLLGLPAVQWLRRLRLLTLLRFLSVSLLMLCVATGLWGTRMPYGNFNMSFFWIVFALGFTYLSMVTGNLYALLNPWQIISNTLTWLWRGYDRPRLTYPTRCAYWPALALYVAFIWVELFARNTPLSLAYELLAYSALNLLGVGLFGSAVWFRYCEFFSVFFRLIASLAPLQIHTRLGRLTRVNLRRPFSLDPKDTIGSFSLLLFVLFMLASTAFDGLHETAIWQRWYWVDIYQCCLLHYGRNPLAAFPKLRETLAWWQTGWLLLSPLIYLVVYSVFIALSRWAGGSRKPISELALAFAPSLLPIVLVYHISHYYTLIQTQGVKIFALASDPFGWGWNLFNTAQLITRNNIPDPNIVWHAQVGLIVAGHVLSVYLAHAIALQQFASPRRAMLSQIPMLLLMMLFTTAGLWILSQPIKAGAG